MYMHGMGEGVTCRSVCRVRAVCIVGLCGVRVFVCGCRQFLHGARGNAVHHEWGTPVGGDKAGHHPLTTQPAHLPFITHHPASAQWPDVSPAVHISTHSCLTPTPPEWSLQGSFSMRTLPLVLPENPQCAPHPDPACHSCAPGTIALAVPCRDCPLWTSLLLVNWCSRHHHQSLSGPSELGFRSSHSPLGTHMHSACHSQCYFEMICLGVNFPCWT